MKKLFKILLITVISLTLALCVIACNKTGSNTGESIGVIEGNAGEYKDNIGTAYGEKPDLDTVVIDGLIDDELWQGKKWYTQYESTHRVKFQVTTAMSPKGFYLAAACNDNFIYWNGYNYFFSNTNFGFQFYSGNNTYIAADANNTRVTHKYLNLRTRIFGQYNVPGKVARVFSVFLCAAMALGCFWAQQGLSALGSMTSGLLTGAEANKITKEPFVIYLSGVDTRGELTEKARSDVNILAVVNPQTKQVALINTPRDYYVDLAGTNSKDKLTHAGLYGVETSMATLGNLYGVNVGHYIRINFAGFINIVDALGGVDVYSDQAFTSVGSPGYYDPTTFAEGWNHLDGKSALAFARERHAFASGDIQRGINQMKVIDAMLNKIKSPALLMGFSKIMDAASDCFVTDFSQDQISALVRMQLSDFANWDIQSYTVTGSSGTSTQCYSAKGQKLYVMKPDEASVSKAKEMIATVLGGEGTVSDTTQTPEKTDVFTPTTDPNAAASIPEEPAESVIVEQPAESVPEETPAETPAEQPAEQPADTQPQEPETPADSGTSDGSTEAPSISLPTQEEVEQAASSLYNAASTILDAIYNAASQNDAA